MSAQDVIAEGVGRGYSPADEDDAANWDADTHVVARFVLAALTAAGYAVVKLPKPEPREDDAEIADCWDHLPHQVMVWDEHPGEVQLCHDFEPAEPLTPAEARALAAALLAAANKAEAVDDE